MGEPQDWRERVVGALGAVIVVALAIGAVVGAVTYGAVRVTGLAGADSPPQTSLSGRHSPGHPAPAAASEPAAAPSQAPQATHTATSRQARERQHADQRPRHRAHDNARHRARKRDRHRHQVRLTLSANPHRVREMGRVNLWGRYPGHGGARLLVQRFKGGHWGRFPVTVTVRGGRFHTWVASGRRGTNRFRVLDPAARRVSPAVTVSVL